MAIQEINSARMCGVQVRVGQGPGQTRFLAYRKHGGISATHHKAKIIEQELEAIWGPRKRSVVGRRMRNNKSGIPGMRFEWRQYSDHYAYLYLTGNYRNKAGKPKSFAYSIEKNGFDGALKLGLAIREKYGAPVMSFAAAKKAIWNHYLQVVFSE